MAILIVDKERLSRQILRAFLESLGLPAVREARHGEEAARVLASDSDIRFLICDEALDDVTWQDFLGAEVAGHPAARNTPFLLTASDGFPFVRDKSLRVRYPRLDGVLLRPFGLSALARAMTRAYVRRMKPRSSLLYVGKDEPAASAILDYLARTRGSQWSSIVTAAGDADVPAVLRANAERIGGILIDPRFCGKATAEQLWMYRNSEKGRPVVAACLSREAETAYPFRAVCRSFAALPKTRAAWKELLDDLALRLEAGWDLQRLRHTFRQAREAHDLPSARTTARAIARSGRHFAEAGCVLGEVEILLERPRQAAAHFRQALDANPFFPGAYLKLLRILDRDPAARPERQALAGAARLYCPRHEQIREVADS